MGSDSDLPVMQGAVDVLAEFGVAHEVRVVSRAPHARGDVRLRAHRGRPRPARDHRGRRRRRAPSRHDRVADVVAGHRRAGAAPAARRPRLAALDRADARRHPGGDGRRRQGAQRGAPRGAHPRRRRRRVARRSSTSTAPRSTRPCARRTPTSVAAERRRVSRIPNARGEPSPPRRPASAPPASPGSIGSGCGWSPATRTTTWRSAPPTRRP